MKKLFTSAAVSLGLTMGFSPPILAQSVDGPFGSKQTLISYWMQNAIRGQAIEIALNGFIVYSVMGVGPANVRDYYVCANGLIRPDCDGLIGPFSRTEKIYSAVTGLVGNRLTATATTLDGNQTIPGLPGIPVGPIYGEFAYRTCPGDASAYGGLYRPPNHDYFVLVSAWALDFGAISGMSCLPRM